MSSQASHRPADAVERWTGLAITILLHVAAIWGLLQFGAVRQAIVDAAPIMVNFITPPQPVAPPEPPAVPRSRPMLLKPPQPAPVLTTQAPESPSPIIAPPAPKAPDLPPIEAEPAPAAVVPPSFGAAYLNNPKPIYPALSRRMGEEGKVLLHVFVSADGAAEKVEVQSSSGSSRLDQAAATAVRAWRFVPARQAGKAVAAWVIVPIVFSLEG
jgi:protein TonB